MRIDRQLTEALVYGSHATHRYTQDSPILADVWIHFGEEPLEWQDLLLTPQWGFDAGNISVVLRDHVEAARTSQESGYRWWRTETKCPADVAYNQVYTAVRLYFEEVIRIVLPMTTWWNELWRQTLEVWRQATGADSQGVTADVVLLDLAEDLALAVAALGLPTERHLPALADTGRTDRAITNLPSDLPWFVRIVGVIAHAVARSIEQRVERSSDQDCEDGPDSDRRRRARLEATDWVRTFETHDREGAENEAAFIPQLLIEAARDLLAGLPVWKAELAERPTPRTMDKRLAREMEGHIHLVNLNRPASPAVSQSRMVIKADAAERLFAIDTSAITWGIIDTGVDATHPAFFRHPDPGESGPEKDASGRVESREWIKWTRVKRTYDFTRIRMLLDPVRLANMDRVPDDLKGVLESYENEFDDLKRSLQRGRAIDWELLEPFLLVPHNDSYREKHIPVNGHGTHVAGILAADWPDRDIVGICKDINLYDLRVMEPGKPNDEFAVLAALQFVQWLNAQKDFFAVHGVNLSLSIHHEVANFACGRTPVCDQCEDLIGAGVTVVAAAGNAGYLKYKTATGPADALDDTTEGYHTVSITDPGNADRVITVGATHREKPHEYGVSYFSSRGPTGDGRHKPDLVAPGEKINSTYPRGGSRPLDGTSMAAPHVSGAAAMLMARHGELIGQPGRIKQALTKTATDLGRERYFQGAGVLDVLRALQSI